jgi:hypothetical protein
MEIEWPGCNPSMTQHKHTLAVTPMAVYPNSHKLLFGAVQSVDSAQSCQIDNNNHVMKSKKFVSILKGSINFLSVMCCSSNGATVHLSELIPTDSNQPFKLTQIFTYN